MTSSFSQMRLSHRAWGKSLGQVSERVRRERTVCHLRERQEGAAPGCPGCEQKPLIWDKKGDGLGSILISGYGT